MSADSLNGTLVMVSRDSESLFSYVVRYDSGFAPNPFHSYCTLATCKTTIRKHARINDWVVGTGSNDKAVCRGGYLVYAMRVTETLSTSEYWSDPRFECKKPRLDHNQVSLTGDNIYERIGESEWRQLDSHHSNADGGLNEDHLRRDTSVDRILISEDYLYYGGNGPKLPADFQSGGQSDLTCRGQNCRRINDAKVISCLVAWLRSACDWGEQGKPWDWIAK